MSYRTIFQLYIVIFFRELFKFFNLFINIKKYCLNEIPPNLKSIYNTSSRIIVSQFIYFNFMIMTLYSIQIREENSGGGIHE